MRDEDRGKNFFGILPPDEEPTEAEQSAQVEQPAQDGEADSNNRPVESTEGLDHFLKHRYGN